MNTKIARRAGQRNKSIGYIKIQMHTSRFIHVRIWFLLFATTSILQVQRPTQELGELEVSSLKPVGNVIPPDPDSVVIIVKSTIPNLRIESNMGERVKKRGESVWYVYLLPEVQTIYFNAPGYEQTERQYYLERNRVYEIIVLPKTNINTWLWIGGVIIGGSCVALVIHWIKRKGIVKRRTNSIFISYRRKDSADITGRIYDRLIRHYGKKKVFIDVDALPLGLDFRQTVDEVIGKCKLFLVVIGNQWLNSMDSLGNRRLDNPLDPVRIEIETAFKRSIPVIPVLVQGATIPSVEDLPSSFKDLSYRNGISIRPDPDFHKDMDRLIEGAEAFLKK